MSKINYATEFTVKRSEWYRGKKGSKLLNDDGMKCCIGFYSLACGLEERDIFNKRVFADLAAAALHDFDSINKSKELNFFGDSGCYAINDNPDYTDVEREEKLTTLLAKGGVKVTFVD